MNKSIFKKIGLFPVLSVVENLLNGVVQNLSLSDTNVRPVVRRLLPEAKEVKADILSFLLNGLTVESQSNT
ncbi:hypothetical protein HZB97_02610 [Candidatus Gottesmanbacteria bacterium]|nr:hypothetical protein [Candidatus Gottesmanbacteria bacterium]